MRKTLIAALAASTIAAACEPAWAGRNLEEPIVKSQTARNITPDNWQRYLDAVDQFERDIFQVLCYYHFNGSPQAKQRLFAFARQTGLAMHVIVTGCNWLRSIDKLQHRPTR